MEHNTTIALLGAGIAMIGAWISAVARNPGAAGKFSTIGYIGFAATELVLLLCFVVAFLLIGKVA
jgi:F0F1-type ATP synthase membrane subunit c/vacuolar-type H+-ATPase subunit K